MHYLREYFVAYVLLLLSLVFLMLFLSAPKPKAHARYDYECCSDRDCAPVPGSSVTASPAGYTVILRPGEHPLVPEGSASVMGFFPYAQARVSPDSEFHACVNPAQRNVICLYAPQGGV